MWPKDTWVSNPIQVSQANANSERTFTFTFRITTALSNGILEVKTPSAVGGFMIQFDGNFDQNQDMSFSTYSLFSISMPSNSGIYGPFSLVTRSSSTGKIYDANYNFGYISISNSVSPLSLTVTNAATNPIIGSTDIFFFTFSLTQSLWKYDIIEIVPSSAYTTTSSISCASVNVPGVTNILYGPKNDNNLPCTLVAQSSSQSGPYSISNKDKFTDNSLPNSIYIYGLAQDVYIPTSSLTVKLSVTSFIYPGYKQPSIYNNWKVNIWRWETNNMIAQYTASIGPVTPNEGTLSASWAPISDIPANDVIIGMSIFTKVSFTTTHDIPVWGFAVINFSDIDVRSSKWWAELDGSAADTNGLCYVVEPINGAYCIAITSIYSVSVWFPKEQKAGSVTIALLIYFVGPNPKITSVTTHHENNNAIDKSSNEVSWPLNTSNANFQFFKFHGYRESISGAYYPDLGTPTAYSQNFIYGADTSNDLFWVFKHSATWTTSTSIVINLPHSTTQTFNLPYIGDNPGKYEIDSDLLTSPQQLYGITTNIFTISGNQTTVTFAIAPTHNYYVMSLTGPTTALPYVASNKGTFYESYAKATTGAYVEIGSSVYSVLAKDYQGTGTYAMPLCLNTRDSGSGIPIVVSFKAEMMDIDFTSTLNSFALEISLQDGGDLGTNLVKGDSIPYYSTVTSIAATLIDITASQTTIKITGLGNVAVSANAINIFLPVGHYPVIYFYSTVTLYYTNPTDPSLKNILYTSFYTGWLSDIEHPLLTANSYSSWAFGSYIYLAISSATFDSTTPQGYYIGVGLPAGFSVEWPLVTVGGTLATSHVYISSSSRNMKGGFVMGINPTSSGFAITPTPTSITVRFVVARSWSGPDINTENNAGLTFFVSPPTPGSDCAIYDTTHIRGEVITGYIASSAVSCDLSSTIASGPDSVDSTMTIGVTLPNGITADGKITLKLNSDFTVYSSTCTVLGLSDLDKDNEVACNYSNGNIIISKFAAFSAGRIVVTIPQILTPSIPGTYSCVNSIETQDNELQYIDAGENLIQNIVINEAGAPGTTSS